MKIKTGKGTIPLITLIAIWSISALTSLPGLAVSPILGDLTKIFPKATDLDIQMLTSLPSLLIIPFILLGGKLTEKVDFVRVLHVPVQPRPGPTFSSIHPGCIHRRPYNCRPGIQPPAASFQIIVDSFFLQNLF